jgi:hypothetical protein
MLAATLRGYRRPLIRNLSGSKALLKCFSEIATSKYRDSLELSTLATRAGVFVAGR